MNERNCPKCGEQFYPGWRFCPKCGWHVPVEEASMEPEDGCKMYIKYHDETPVEYLYGPEWKAMELLMDGGYPTPEEARAAWEREKNKTQR